MADLKRIVPDVELAMGPLLKVGGGRVVVLHHLYYHPSRVKTRMLYVKQNYGIAAVYRNMCCVCRPVTMEMPSQHISARWVVQLFGCVAERGILIECFECQYVPCQAQAPKLKTDVLEMESELKKRCDATVVGDYTLWITGPEAALDMLRVSPLENTA